jgi:hypothetical protein
MLTDEVIEKMFNDEAHTFDVPTTTPWGISNPPIIWAMKKEFFTLAARSIERIAREEAVAERDEQCKAWINSELGWCNKNSEGCGGSLNRAAAHILERMKHKLFPEPTEKG